MDINKLITIVLGVFLFTALIGPIANQIVGAQGGNVTGASSTILGLTVLVLAIGFVASIVKMSGLSSKR